MNDVLMALVVLVVASIVVTLAAAALGVWILCRTNRVHPRSRAGAPVVWLVSPARPARTHRRLRSSVRSTLGHPDWPDALRDALDELHEHAVRLDTELVRVARLPRPDRRREVAALGSQVVLVERTAVRLVGLARTPPTAVAAGAAPGEDGLSTLVERVRLIEAARHELAAGPTAVPSSADAARAPSTSVSLG